MMTITITTLIKADSDTATARTWMLDDATAELIAGKLGEPASSTIITNAAATVRQALPNLTVITEI